MLIAIELLLFEYRARSVVPVALAARRRRRPPRDHPSAPAPVFTMPAIGAPIATTDVVATRRSAALVGVVSVYVTRIVYWIEDCFEELPIHWMWWPALGAVAVGVIGVLRAAHARRRLRQHRGCARRRARGQALLVLSS